jgi:hypothetical protein
MLRTAYNLRFDREPGAALTGDKAVSKGAGFNPCVEIPNACGLIAERSRWGFSIFHAKTRFHTHWLRSGCTSIGKEVAPQRIRNAAVSFNGPGIRVGSAALPSGIHRARPSRARVIKTR